MDNNMFFDVSSQGECLDSLAENLYSTNYIISDPLRLTFETVHPADHDENFIVSMMTPSFSTISVIPAGHPNNPSSRTELHTHGFYELMYVIKGELYQNIEYERHLYPQGSLCLVNKNIHHAEEFSTDYRCLFLMISDDFLNSIFFPKDAFVFDEHSILSNSFASSFFGYGSGNRTNTREYIDFIPNKDDLTVNKKMYDRFDRLTNHMLYPSLGSTFAIKSAILEIFGALLDEKSYSTIPINIGSDKEFQVFDHINSSMNRHNGRISRSQLEKELSYSGSYLNAICKKYSGLSLFDYGMRFCMEKACKMLEDESINITDIIEQLGFTNRSHFNSIFKEHYKLTPSEYRKQKSVAESYNSHS